MIETIYLVGHELTPGEHSPINADFPSPALSKKNAKESYRVARSIISAIEQRAGRPVQNLTTDERDENLKQIYSYLGNIVGQDNDAKARAEGFLKEIRAES